MAHILIIDDDERIRTLLRKTLENDGHVVSVAHDGQEALRIFNSSVELVVSDVLMPGMTGFEMIDRLRQRSPCIPIISMSAGGQIRPHEYLRIAGAIGANRTLTKPFLDWELRDLITELLPRHETSLEAQVAA
jgi:CheY-like chemotaxis protein